MEKLTALDCQKGYTLVEVTLVLTAFTVLLLIFAPLQQRTVNKIENDHYLKQFEEDMLLAQQLTMSDHPNYWIMVRPLQNDYYLYDYQNKKTIYHRVFPHDWEVRLQSLTSPIRFNSTGTMQSPGTMAIKTHYTNYKITFPFGKSRVRIDEQ
ncbi:competence type IV pilus minor pilin ComGD [Halobacillus sp. B23F22_1]|uniref:competence type IV pilus minor pilin ComGD n=1 Tax=Halobacillus sp. B23F22_1 TaxID=3459514 RepID=UPI00373F7AD9